VAGAAAAQGFADAQIALGGLSAEGRNVPLNYVRASRWLTHAAAHSKGDVQKDAADFRDDVARRMTPAQIAEAKRLAQQCEAQGLKGC
jgi:TPR repeat protein